jgi:hypothetical protein
VGKNNIKESLRALVNINFKQMWRQRNSICGEFFLTLDTAGLDHQFRALTLSDAFGGDRNQITLIGHSAGAASVVYHLISPRTNLFIQR